MGGTLPTLSRWIRGGSHEFMEWTPTLPATTPASQMGILHGTTDGIPAFRWVDRATGRVFVANKPADAVDIEALHSDGRGLLADGGVSVSNLFSGDAPTTFATMSRVGALRGDRDGRRRFNRFLMRPDGFMRGVVRTTSELVRERTQARRQVRQDMRPRVHRGWDFAGERGALNGVMRDFNSVMVGEALAVGCPQHLRRLRRLRRGRPPRRHHAARVARRAGGARLPPRPAREGRRRGQARLPHRGAVRPRPVAGRGVRRPLRREPVRPRLPAHRHHRGRAPRSTPRGRPGSTCSPTSSRPSSPRPCEPAAPTPSSRRRPRSRPRRPPSTSSAAAGGTDRRCPGAADARLRLREPRPGVRQRRGPPAHPGRDRGAVARPAPGPGRARGRVVPRRGHRGRPGRDRSRAASTGCATVW